METIDSPLTRDERCRVGGSMEMGLGATEIARRLGRYRATIHRELGRNISIEPPTRHLSSSVRWLYIVPMASPDIAGGALEEALSRKGGIDLRFAIIASNL